MKKPLCEILIPVFNGYEQTRRCIEHVIDLTPSGCTIHVLDDASSDLRLLDWLAGIEIAQDNLKVTRSDENLGFVGNVNRGLADARTDVIVLNSDTIVTAGWIEKLIACAESDPKIGLVCPLSNNATILSVPFMNRDNPLPDGLDVAAFAALIERCSQHLYPRLPVAVGFCMLIRHPLLEHLGLLHRAYHRGYGEECDYSLRAWEAGYEVVCCDDTFVYHEGEQSFGSVAGMDAVKRRNASVLLERWPFYDRLVQRFCQLNPLREVQEHILTELQCMRGDCAPHLLQVLHSYHALGGTELHSRSVTEGAAEDYRVTVLFPGRIDDAYLDVECVLEHEHEWVRVLKCRSADAEGDLRVLGHIATLRDAVVEAGFTRLLRGGRMTLVHFQHLLNWGSLELPLIAKRFGARVLLSLHDYFLFCPIFDMLLPAGTPCGKSHACADDPECLSCLAHYASGREGEDEQALGHYLEARQAKLIELFRCADAIISPSDYVKDRFTRAFGAELGAKVRVLTHGIPELARVAHSDGRGVPRLGVFANLTRRKGGDLLLETLNRLRRGRRPIEILHFGGTDVGYAAGLEAAGVQCRGVYRLERLPRLVSEVDLALVPSVYEETFCLTIAELQSLGTPVLALPVGAIPERIRDCETGFLAHETGAVALARKIESLLGDTEQLAHMRSKLKRFHVKRIDENVEEYRALYRELIDDAVRPPSQRLDLAPCPSSDVTRTDEAVETPTEISQAFLRALEPAWGGHLGAYGEPRYRRWVERAGHETGVCSGAARPDDGAITLAVLELERRPGAIESTLLSLSRADSSRARILIISRFEPCHVPEAIAARCVWRRMHVDQQPARFINRALSEDDRAWIGWLNAGDRLHPSALAVVADYIDSRAEWRFIYTDEDVCAEDGRRYRPRFKPDLNLDLLRCQAYIGDLCLINRDAFRACGGLAPFTSMALHDLCFKVIERYGEDAVGHIAQILYHRADDRERVEEQQDRGGSESEKIIAGHLERSRLRGRVNKTGMPGLFWVDYPLPRQAPLGVVVITRSDGDAAGQVIDNFRSVYERLEVVVLDFKRKGPPMSRVRSQASDVPINIVRAKSSDNVACSLNAALRLLSTDLVLVTHDGVRIRQRYALSMLCGLLARADVALAGPCILDEDGRILQGYPVTGFQPFGALGQLHRGETLAEAGFMRRNLSMQNCATVSDHLFGLWKPAFDQVGGFNETDYPSAWFMLDLGLRLARQGHKVVWTPHATAVEVNEGSYYRYRRQKLRGDKVAAEVARLYAQWLPRLANDPAYNPNLGLRDTRCEPDVELARGWDPARCASPRILGFPGDASGSGHYRVIEPLNALHTHGLACRTLLPEPKRARAPNIVELARLAPGSLLLHNSLHDQHLHALELYRHYSDATLIFSLDDLITDLPPWNPFRHTNYADIERRLDFVLERCQRLVLNTTALADAYGMRHADIRVVPNRLAGSRWLGLTESPPQRDASSRGRKPRIGWAGAAQHADDLAWMAPFVEALSEEVEWCFLGMCPAELKPFASTVLPMVDYTEYPQALARLRLDVAIAPLMLHDFNRCKSQIKLLEYGILGIPVVCTDIEPYRDAPVERLPNDPARWLDALRARIADQESARREGAELQHWVRSGWMLEDGLDQWLDAVA